MTYPSYPNSFVAGDSIDAPLFNQNFNQLIFDLSEGEKDLKAGACVVNNELLVATGMDATSMTVNTTFEAQTANVSGNIVVGGVSLMDHVFGVSAESQLYIEASDIANGIISTEYGLNKLVFQTGIVTADFHKIKTTNFVDGDIITLYNAFTYDNPPLAQFTLINSHVSGNLRIGSDLTLPDKDTVSLLYNGVQDTFDLFCSSLDVNKFF